MKTLYQCDTCRAQYDNIAKALSCEAQKLPTNIKVGDIIKKHDGYGWHTGPDHWIMFDTGTFHGRSTRDFYWLVLEVNPNAGSWSGHHCNRITCVSRGVVNGASVDAKGDWGIQRFNDYVDKTYAGNYAEVVKRPPRKVRKEANEFIRRGYVIDPHEIKVTTKKGN